LKLARRLGKKVFFTLQGCDVRLAGDSERRNSISMCCDGACDNLGVCKEIYDNRRLRLIKNVLPLTQRTFYLNPDLGRIVPEGTFLPYASVDVESFELIPPRENGVIRLVHAPTDPSIKGTPLIQRAIDKLKKKYPIELTLVHGVPHEQAMRAYRDADLAIDQLLAGWYGGFAVEMMAMGKPVICYLREKDLGFLPPSMRGELPIITAQPDDLEAVLGEVFEQRHKWSEWSERSRRFVLKWHNPRYIAHAMIAAYRDPYSQFDLQMFVDME
jgi:hypothetical protein